MPINLYIQNITWNWNSIVVLLQQKIKSPKTYKWINSVEWFTAEPPLILPQLTINAKSRNLVLKCLRLLVRFASIQCSNPLFHKESLHEVFTAQTRIQASTKTTCTLMQIQSWLDFWAFLSICVSLGMLKCMTARYWSWSINMPWKQTNDNQSASSSDILTCPTVLAAPSRERVQAALEPYLRFPSLRCHLVPENSPYFST
jgi:hypothetical protein